jgi:tripartite ATP-independent transporter DctM subunit
VSTLRYVLPQGIVVFLVVGVIFLGVATPSEAAATGCVGTIALALCYRRLGWSVIKKSIIGTLSVTGMLFLIMSGATAFSQILSFSGATTGITELATGINVAPLFIIIVMQVIILFLGGFLDVVSIMMITLPIFVPVVKTLGFDAIWFAVIFLINIEMAGISPPFGLSLFVMKGVTSSETSMGDIYRAALPFIGLSIIAMAIVMTFPKIALWLPGLMH